MHSLAIFWDLVNSGGWLDAWWQLNSIKNENKAKDDLILKLII